MPRAPSLQHYFVSVQCNDITELGRAWSGHYLEAGDEMSDGGGDTIPEIHASRDDGSSINTRICHDSSH